MIDIIRTLRDNLVTVSSDVSDETLKLFRQYLHEKGVKVPWDANGPDFQPDSYSVDCHRFNEIGNITICNNELHGNTCLKVRKPSSQTPEWNAIKKALIMAQNPFYKKVQLP